MTIEYLDAKRVQGQLGSAGSASFDGSNDKVTAGGTASTYGFLTGNGGSDWSLACWLKPTITHQDVFFDQCNGETAGTGVSFRFNVSGSNKKVQCGLSDGSTFSFFESNAVWTDGDWQHMCVTYDSSASAMTIYRNGTNVGSSSSIPSNNGTPTHAFTIGEAGAGNDNAYEGYMNDLLLTDDILSSTEISALASGTKVSDVSPAIDNQELHYTFLTDFTDSSGQSGRNGTASGATISSSVSKFSKPDDKATLIDSATWESPTVGSTGWNIGSGEALTIRLDTGNPILGKPVTSITYLMGDSNSPTGSSNVYIYNGTTLKATADETLDDSTIGSSYADQTFNFTGNTYNMVNGDYIAIVRQSGGSGTWRIKRTGQGVGCSNALIFSGNTTSGAPYISDGSDSQYCFGQTANIKSVSSNLPENTIFNETDTRYQYWLQSGKWQPTTMYGTDFTSSTGWTFNDSNKMSIDTTNGTLDFEPERDQSNDAGAYDLGKVITAEKWRIRFKWKFTKNVASGGDVGAGNGFYVGLSDKTQASGQNTSQDFIGLQMYRDNQDTFGGIDCDGATVPRIYDGEDEQDVDIGGTSTTYYNEISRTGASTYTVKMWTGSYDGTSMGTASCTCSSSIAGLRYIKIFNEDVQNLSTQSTDIAIEVFDLEFAQG